MMVLMQACMRAFKRVQSCFPLLSTHPPSDNCEKWSSKHLPLLTRTLTLILQPCSPALLLVSPSVVLSFLPAVRKADWAILLLQRMAATSSSRSFSSAVIVKKGGLPFHCYSYPRMALAHRSLSFSPPSSAPPPPADFVQDLYLRELKQYKPKEAVRFRPHSGVSSISCLLLFLPPSALPPLLPDFYFRSIRCFSALLRLPCSDYHRSHGLSSNSAHYTLHHPLQAANAHVGQVKEFHSPTAPQAPVVPTGADLAKELEAYDREVRWIPCLSEKDHNVLMHHLLPQEVSASPGASSSSASPEDLDAESAAASSTQTADEYISFVEQEARKQPDTEAHH